MKKLAMLTLALGLSAGVANAGGSPAVSGISTTQLTTITLVVPVPGGGTQQVTFTFGGGGGGVAGLLNIMYGN